MDISLNGDEIIGAYQKELLERNHQLILVKAALEKAQAKIRDFEAALGMTAEATENAGAPDGSLASVKSPQRARQVAPGLNGHGQPVKGSESV